MKNLAVNKGNIKKLVMCVGLGGVIVFSTLTWLMKNEKVQEIMPDPVKQITQTITGDSNLSYSNNLHLSNKEFLDRFEDEYNKSDNLKKDWKDIYPQIREFVGTYGEYLDQEQLLKCLSTLKIVSNANVSGSDTLATYDSKTNTIKLSKNLNYKKQTEINKTLLHESLHFIFQDGFYESSRKYYKKGLMLDEGMVSLLNQEFEMNDGGDNYKKASSYVRVLCELLGEEEVMKAAGTEGLEYLIGRISDYTSEKEAVALIDNIDKASYNYNSRGTDYDKKAWETLDSIYQQKYGVSVKDSDDEIMKLYSNQTLGKYYDIAGRSYSININTNKKYFINKGGNSIIIEKNGTREEINLYSNSKTR